jgi:hypothetical protein
LKQYSSFKEKLHLLGLKQCNSFKELHLLGLKRYSSFKELHLLGLKQCNSVRLQSADASGRHVACLLRASHWLPVCLSLRSRMWRESSSQPPLGELQILYTSMCEIFSTGQHAVDIVFLVEPQCLSLRPFNIRHYYILGRGRMCSLFPVLISIS